MLLRLQQSIFLKLSLHLFLFLLLDYEVVFLNTDGTFVELFLPLALREASAVELMGALVHVDTLVAFRRIHDRGLASVTDRVSDHLPSLGLANECLH